VYLKESLVRNIVFPLIDIANRESVLRYLDLYEKSQWWNLKELERMQEKKLRALIRHAWNNVPYYRRIFKTAFSTFKLYGCISNSVSVRNFLGCHNYIVNPHP